jgi:hypothetical protein
MTKLGRRAARPLASGVIAPPTTATRCIIIPMKLKSSSLASIAWQTAVGENSRVEQDQPDVNTETTPDEHRVLQDAHEALITLRRSFDNWVTVGRGLQLLRQKADQIGTRNAFNDLRDQHRLGDKHLRKEAVSRLLKVMDNLQAVLAWRATLTEKQRVDWASPDTIVRRCPIFKGPKTATAQAKPSPYSKLQQANAELQIELHDLKQRVAGGDLFDLKNDSAETIAGTIITKAGIDKAAKIARAILNSPQHDEREQAEREFADGGEELTERTVKRPTRGRDQEAEGGIRSVRRIAREKPNPSRQVDDFGRTRSEWVE